MPVSCNSRGRPKDQLLFRAEALQGTDGGPWQPPILSRGVSGWALTGGCLVCIASIVWFANVFEFSGKERAKGHLVPTEGWSRITAPKGGVVKQVAVRSGDRVKKGDVVVEMEIAIGAARGAPVGVSFLATLDEQRAIVERRRSFAELQYKERRREILAQKELLRRQIGQQRTENRAYESMLALAAARFGRAQQLRGSNALSHAALLELAEELAGRTAALAMKRGTLLGLLAELDSMASELRRAKEAKEERLAAIEQEMQSLFMEETRIRNEHMTIVMAPRSGTASSIRVEAGDWIQRGDALLDILPVGLDFKAQLVVDSDSIGNIQLGQRVMIHIDGFPVERFGVQEGEVMHIGETAQGWAGHVGDSGSGAGKQNTVFLVDVGFPSDILLGGKELSSLKPGMTVRADVVSERLTIADWITRPLQRLAVGY